MDQERSITVKIAGTEYCLKVKSAEEEELYRLAADSVNKRVQTYQQRFLGKPETDIIAFTAFSVCLSNVKSVRAMEAMNKEIEKLHGEIESYLGNIEEK